MKESRNVHLSVNDNDQLEKIGDSFSSGYRRRILFLLSKRSYSTQELLDELKISPSTLSFHLKILREAKLIKFVKAPSKRGNEKNLSLNIDSLVVNFDSTTANNVKTENIDIGLGSFSKFEVKAPCLIATENEILQPIDNDVIFNSTDKIKAQLISFTEGYIEYLVSNDLLYFSKIKELSFTQEICSECPNFNNNWKSDISFYLNNIKIGEFLSLGDYGGRLGLFSPQWWPTNSSNYGILVNVTINDDGTFINGKKTSDLKINEYFKEEKIIKYRIGVDHNSKHLGGINIFGRHFGDFKQNISLNITYIDK
ncbi:MAG: ArsR family transcriptional regulator [Bacilli bacterium]|nr:ArsR family transcriptional regulator [Bacilli bacterium]